MGESDGDVPISNVRADCIRCPRPTAALEELTALFWALASNSSVTTRLHIEFFRTVTTGVVEGRTRAQRATGLVHQATDMLQQARQLHRVLIHHVRAHSGVAGSEVAYVLANTGPIRGPAPVQRFAPQCFHDLDPARGSKQPRRMIQLDALLFWEATDNFQIRRFDRLR